jgi:myosin heavy subunit
MATLASKLESVDEPALVAAVRERFAEGALYTDLCAGVVLFANPFSWEASDPLYGEEVVSAYCKAGAAAGAGGEALPPQVYAIAERAYCKAALKLFAHARPRARDADGGAGGEGGDDDDNWLPPDQ